MAETKPGYWITGNAWLDADERHVWAAHTCVGGRVVTMLPWPTWHSSGTLLEPSFSCWLCGYHSIIMLGVPDDDHRCMETGPLGRWCELVRGHHDTHRNGVNEWGTYRPTEV